MLEEQRFREKIKDWLCNEGVGVLAYKRGTGEPYVKKLFDEIALGESVSGEFVMMTRQVYQNSLYLAFYTATDGGEEERMPMVSGCVKLPERLSRWTKVIIKVTANSADAELKTEVSVPSAGYSVWYVANGLTGGKLLPEKREPEERWEERRSESDIQKQAKRALEQHAARIVGMEAIKRELQSVFQVMLLGEELEKEGKYMEKCNWHFLIGGDSGSGKTLLAETIHDVLHRLELSVKNPVRINAVQLLANPELLQDFVDGKEKKTVIVDNFEKLCPPEAEGQGVADNDEFWILLFQCMEKAKKEEGCHFVFSGDTKAVRRLTEKRKKLSAYVTSLLIPAYTQEELSAIGRRLMRDAGFVFEDEEAKAEFDKCISEMMVQPDFANGYSLKYIIGEAQKRKGDRYNGKETYLKFRKEDFIREVEKEETLEELLERLDAMTGLSGVKRQIRQRLNILKMEKLRKERGLSDKSNPGSLHMVFYGNAGTGKTTIARLVGKIYGKAGLIKNGNNFVEASRESLVAGYQGQSAIKAMECVERAIGGILFLDEAYNLVNDEHDTFGMEVLNTLIAPIENNRENLTVIMAGYKEEMEELFLKNQGLASRMHTIIEFEDYSKEELGMIFYRMAEAEGYRVAGEHREAVTEYLWQKRTENEMEFANARGVRNCFEDAKLRQATRLVEQEETQELSNEELMTLRLEDICGE